MMGETRPDGMTAPVHLRPAGVALALSLAGCASVSGTSGGDAAGTHAQEGAVPVDHRKDGRADGEGGDVGVVADAPGDRGVGHAQQRDGDVRDDVRQRQTQDLAVSRGESEGHQRSAVASLL